MQWAWIVGSLCLALFSQALADRNKQHKTEWKSNNKQHHVGHWGEHYISTSEKPNNPNIKDVLKHAPGIVPRHESRMQSDFGYRKRSQQKHKEHDDLYLQDLALEDSVYHQRKLQKPSVHHNHSNDPHWAPSTTHHRPGKVSNEEAEYQRSYKNMHIPPEVTKSHPDKKEHRGQDKKFPKKFNKAKHEKKLRKPSLF